eukprot:10750170-Karenia_brevis.AAC.1
MQEQQHQLHQQQELIECMQSSMRRDREQHRLRLGMLHAHYERRQKKQQKQIEELKVELARRDQLQRGHLFVRKERVAAESVIANPPGLAMVNCNAAIAECEEEEQWEQASKLYEMRKAGMSSNVNSLNAASSACEKRGQWDQALSLQEGMRKTNGTQNAE